MKHYPNVLVGPRKGQKCKVRDGFYAFLDSRTGFMAYRQMISLWNAAETIVKFNQKTPQ
jgi:hypothetical protein